MDFLKDLLKKKKTDGEDEIDPSYKKAKMSVLQQIKDLAESSMGDDIKGVKKVTVASDNPEDLAKGLDKAKEMIGSDEETKDHADRMDFDGKEVSPFKENPKEEDEDDGLDMSPEEVENMMRMLEKRKAKFRG